MNKNDSIVQSTCRRTTLATLLLWHSKNQENPRSLSELVRLSLEGFEEILRINGETVIEDTYEATSILSEFRIGNLNPCGRGNKNLYLNLTGLPSLSRQSRDIMISSLESERKKSDPLSRENLDPLVKQKMKEWREPEQDLKDEDDWSSSNLKKALAGLPEGMVVLTKQETQEIQGVSNVGGIVATPEGISNVVIPEVAP